jgi:hypothetical protein
MDFFSTATIRGGGGFVYISSFVYIYSMQSTKELFIVLALCLKNIMKI